MFNADIIHKYYSAYKNSTVSTVISPDETMHNQWYDDVGTSAVEVVLAAMASSFLGQVSNVMDMPCGHGRVLRHLVKLFPDAKFTACDLDKSGVAFCAREFGAEPLLSEPELASVDFNKHFDIIWVGSLFTHTPEDQTARWLEHLTKFLSPTGILISTFHGRRAIKMYEYGPFIASDSWQKIVKQYDNSGYGYASYTAEETHEYMDNDYGISLSNPSKILDLAQGIPGIRIFQYAERAWADNQDVLVIGKPAIDS